MAVDIAVNKSAFFKAGQAKKEKQIDNPKGNLDGDDFLKLFLETLKYQDPTAPMKTQDMMIQTAQLTTVETNVANKKALEAVVKTLTSSTKYQSQFGLIPAIGKLAVTKDTSVKFDGLLNSDFELYFKEMPKSGNITIKDKAGQTVKNISIGEYKNRNGVLNEDENGRKIKESKGTMSFTWDGNDDRGVKVATGDYFISASYVGKNSKVYTVDLGTNIIESVKFDAGMPYLKLGSKYIPFSKVSEVK